MEDTSKVYVVKAMRHYYGPHPDIITFVGHQGFTDIAFARRFRTKEEAQTFIVQLDLEPYFLESGESGRPDFAVVRID